MPDPERPVNVPPKVIAPRVAGTSRYSFFIGAMTSAPNLIAWLPRSHDTVSMNSSWLVCWNLGRKSGEPRRPRPDPPKSPVTERPGKPPATVGSVIMPGICADVGGASPNAWCTASDTDCDHENRASFTVRDDSTRVHPPTTALVLIFWLPNADVPVPSITPPNAPGIWRSRFE